MVAPRGPRKPEAAPRGPKVAHEDPPQPHEDHGSVGCAADVRPYVAGRCSGRRRCRLDIPDASLHAAHPCPKELMPYLEASYSCVTGKPCIAYSICSVMPRYNSRVYRFMQWRSFSSEFEIKPVCWTSLKSDHNLRGPRVICTALQPTMRIARSCTALLPRARDSLALCKNAQLNSTSFQTNSEQ